MKNITLCIFLLSVSSLAAASDLEGVWELVSGEYVNEEGELVEYQSLELESLKLISGSHFSFTSMKGEEFWAAGSGTYEVKGGEYIETLHHNSFGQEPGSTYRFDTKIEENRWYNSRWEDEKRVEYEVWRRID